MQQFVKVTYDDGRVAEGVVGLPELIEFERHFHVGVSQLATDGRVEWVTYLAYLAMRRLHKAGEHPGLFKPTFDGFIETVADVDLADAEDADPLGASPSLSESPP